MRVASWNCRQGFDAKAEFVDGLGVFAFGGHRVQPMAEPPVPQCPPWLLPLDVVGPAGERVARLLAVWTEAVLAALEPFVLRPAGATSSPGAKSAVMLDATGVRIDR